MEKKELLKWIAVLILVFAAAYLLLSFYNNKSEDIDIKQQLSLEFEKVGYFESLESLSKSKKVCIIEDIEGLVDPVRGNVMNCGIKIASTAPLQGINITAFALENNGCYSANGKKSEQECYSQIIDSGCFVFYIGSDKIHKVDSYSKMIVLPISEELDEQACQITT